MKESIVRSMDQKGSINYNRLNNKRIYYYIVVNRAFLESSNKNHFKHHVKKITIF